MRLNKTSKENSIMRSAKMDRQSNLYKNSNRTNDLDCALGQVLCMNHFLGCTPVVCTPSDLPPDIDFKVVCKRYGVILCDENTISELLS
jgi:hypothetical protein